MNQKLKFKRYRGIVSEFGLPLSFSRKITPKQSTILQKLSQLARKKKKLSYFGQKLQSKRLFSFLYGNLPRKQFFLFLNQASKLQGSLSADFLSLLERRLDIVIYRMFQFRTLPSARQYIRHKGVLVNDCLVNLSSFQLSSGDIIAIKDPAQFLNQKTKLLDYFQGSTTEATSAYQGMRSISRPVGVSNLKNLAYSNKKLEDRLSKLRIRYPHFEVNYKILTGIFLFSPKQIFYSIKIKKEDFIPKDISV
jgi:ribosomal protein S4